MNQAHRISVSNDIFPSGHMNNKAFALFFWFVSILGGGAIGLLVVYTSGVLVLWLLLGILSAILFFYKSEYGLLALIFIAYTYASNVVIVNFGLPSIMKPLIGLLVLIILFRWVLYGERPQGWLRSFLVLSGYGFIGLLSFFYAKDTYIVREWLIDFAKDAVIAIVIAILIQRLATLRRLIWALLVSGIFLGSLNTYQALTGTFENNYWGFSKAEHSQIVGESNNWRTGGPGFGPNGFAQIMVVLVPLALERFWNERKTIMRIFAGWALVVCVLSVFYTYSRSAFLGLVAVLAAMMIYRHVKLSTLLTTILLFGVLQSYMPAQYTDRLLTLVDFIPNSDSNQTAEYSFRGRISENLAAWRMFVDHPITGVGLHNYGVNYQTYSREIGLDSRREERTPHSLYLEIASEMGLLGLSWLGVFLWVIISGLRQARNELKDIGLREYEGLVMAIGVSLLGFLITSLYQHLAYPRYFWILFGIALVIPNVVKQELNIRNQTGLDEAG
jgi:O-antigen ligase